MSVRVLAGRQVDDRADRQPLEEQLLLVSADSAVQ